MLFNLFTHDLYMEYNVKDIIYVIILALLALWIYNISSRHEQFASDIQITGINNGDDATIIGKLKISELEVTGAANINGLATFNGGTNLDANSGGSGTVGPTGPPGPIGATGPAGNTNNNHTHTSSRRGF